MLDKEYIDRIEERSVKNNRFLTAQEHLKQFDRLYSRFAEAKPQDKTELFQIVDLYINIVEGARRFNLPYLDLRKSEVISIDIFARL